MSVSHHPSEAFILIPRVSNLVCVRQRERVCVLLFFCPAHRGFRAAAGAGWEELACIVAISTRSSGGWRRERKARLNCARMQAGSWMMEWVWRGVQKCPRACSTHPTTLIACPRLSRITEGVKLSGCQTGPWRCVACPCSLVKIWIW